MIESEPIKIGDHVLVYRITEVKKSGNFTDGTLRHVAKRRAIEPMHAVVTGMKRLRTGVAGSDDIQYELVYTVRTGWLNREISVLPNDMQVIDEPLGTPPLRGRLPMLGQRPKSRRT